MSVTYSACWFCREVYLDGDGDIKHCEGCDEKVCKDCWAKDEDGVILCPHCVWEGANDQKGV